MYTVIARQNGLFQKKKKKTGRVEDIEFPSKWNIQGLNKNN